MSCQFGKGVRLNIVISERLGNGRNIEISVNDELLKMLIELLSQLTKLKEMDNDGYKGG